MAENLVASVRREIDRLKKEIDQRNSQLAFLKGELKRHERVYQFLGGGDRAARRPRTQRRKGRRTAPVDWNSMLHRLPSRFTIRDLAKANDAKGKSPVYLRQIAVRWAKQGKTKRVGRGKYQGAQQWRSRAAVTPQSEK